MSSALPPLVAPGPPLTPDQVARYARHLALDEIGEVGQRRLLASRVLVLGAGGLGSPVLLYLAAAGVGTLGIVDDDVVEVSNLQRQVVHGTADVGRRKVDSAADAVRGLDPHLEVVPHAVRLGPGNAGGLLGAYDVVVDGTDNFPTRYLVDDVCAELGRPWVWGSLQRGHAQVSTFWSRPPVGEGVGLRDVFGGPPSEGTVPSCAVDGVLGAVCAAAGAAMAIEVVKLLCGSGRTLLGRVAVHDAFAGTWQEVPVRRAQGRTDRAVPRAGTAPDRGAGPGSAAGADDLATLVAAHAAGAVDVVDLRDAPEASAHPLPGVRAVPLAQFVTEQMLASLDPDRPLVLVCRLGARAAHAAALARAAGVRDVRHLPGGVAAWRLAAQDRATATPDAAVRGA
ncbi:ThiF family adenylyltransferase [Cellulomonas phragmiteti]|uniref:Adenylyltransferase/sulfurtransferase MoeZ n=1 Tax=Cellulomonas phragmiteti TaxID=478780 RepID=A0ABQ4DK71_9CELL|nr:ThiF family adenylyltransferase [Cellulomonas phragmiteti]GIG39754.1 putative adenylyltransferase/sulfurtransferase MoeZ [Cellulomonas phragmiteti]